MESQAGFYTFLECSAPAFMGGAPPTPLPGRNGGYILAV